MKLLDKILVNVNLENTSFTCIEAAETLASKFNSSIIFLAVLPKEAKLNSIKNFVKKFTDQQVARITEHLKYPKEKVDIRIEYGNAFEVITNISEDENVNLIINPNTEFNTESDIKIDVLSEKLVRKSEKPVMILKPGMNLEPKNILCLIDFSESSERALRNAIKITKIFQSKLRIINVIEPLRESFPMRMEIDLEEETKRAMEENEKQLNKFMRKFNLIDLDYSVNTYSGKTREVVTKITKEHAIDYIFLGATGKSYVQRLLLGSVTENILRDFPTTMIVLKAENMLDLKIESDISTIEKHLNQAIKLEESGFYEEAIEQLRICLTINDLHLPVLNRLSKLHAKLGNTEQSENYQKKFDEVLRRLWNKKIEYDIRKGLTY